MKRFASVLTLATLFGSREAAADEQQLVIAISATQTVLWHQVMRDDARAPDNAEYMFPVRPNARVEAGHHELVAAVEIRSAPIVWEPGGGETSSCNCSREGPEATSESSYQRDVPYPTPRASPEVTRLTTAQALARRPEQSAAIQAYADAGYELLVVKYTLECGAYFSSPIRIITPSSEPTVPLKLLGGGRTKVFVFSEGRMDPDNAPTAQIDASKLLWDNYGTLAETAMADGRTWLMEASLKSVLDDAPSATAFEPPDTTIYSASLREQYFRGCSVIDACAPQAVVDAGDAGALRPAVTEHLAPPSCPTHDDIDVMLEGLSRHDTWLTRWHANLDPTALTDVHFALGPQTAIENQRVAYDYVNRDDGFCAHGRGLRGGRNAIFCAVAVVAVAFLRRRRW